MIIITSIEVEIRLRRCRSYIYIVATIGMLLEQKSNCSTATFCRLSPVDASLFKLLSLQRLIVEKAIHGTRNRVGAAIMEDVCTSSALEPPS